MRIEITILKIGAKHEVTKKYLGRLTDASRKMSFTAECRDKLYCLLLSYLSVVQSSRFIVGADRFLRGEGGYVMYIPFVPVTETGERLWEFTFVFAVTNESDEQPAELAMLTDEETESIYKTIVVGSPECPRAIDAMYILGEVRDSLKEL